jgi:hypothetical protein
MISYINEVCKAVTGMSIFELHPMLWNGYVPTISQGTRRGRILTRILKAKGYRIFERS